MSDAVSNTEPLVAVMTMFVTAPVSAIARVPVADPCVTVTPMSSLIVGEPEIAMSQDISA